MDQTLEPGASFAGHRIERLIGRGGMGQVYLAAAPVSGRPVALKVLPAELAGEERFRARFERESRLAASLSHPHVVPVVGPGRSTARCGCRCASSTARTWRRCSRSAAGCIPRMPR